MRLTSVEKIENGWKIQYESKATDGIPVKVKYPSFNDIGLGKPTRDFLASNARRTARMHSSFRGVQAVAPFLRFAIAISHLAASMDDLEEQVEKYVNGDRATEQLELLPSTVKEVVTTKIAIA